VNLLTFLDRVKGHKDHKCQMGQIAAGQRCQKLVKGSNLTLEMVQRGFWRFRSRYSSVFLRMSSRFGLSRRSGSNHALRFSFGGSKAGVIAGLSRFWVFGGILGCEEACS
jgi:hypothetical protein